MIDETELSQDIENPTTDEQPKKRKRLKEGDAYYVKNADLLVEITKYREDYDKWVEEGEKPEQRPQMSRFLGEMLSKIAHRAVYHPKFIKFPSIREEMVSDAIANMMRYGHNFNPYAETRSGYPNPFGYFTQICNNSYIQRIMAEKRQFLIKAKYVQSEHMRDQLEEVFADTDVTGDNVASTIRMYYNVELPEHEEKSLPLVIVEIDEDGNEWTKHLDPETNEYGLPELTKEYEPVGLETFFE